MMLICFLTWNVKKSFILFNFALLYGYDFLQKIFKDQNNLELVSLVKNNKNKQHILDIR